jgi:uncharacterized coiled-coil DUF342 family protein
MENILKVFTESNEMDEHIQEVVYSASDYKKANKDLQAELKELSQEQYLKIEALVVNMKYTVYKNAFQEGFKTAVKMYEKCVV